MSGEELKIPDAAGNYLSGDYVKEHDIREVEIIGDPINVTFDRDGKSETKVQAPIKFVGQGKDDPNKWTMNATTARLLAEFFGTNKPHAWRGKIPIETSLTTKGYAVFADKTKLKKMKQGVLA